MIDKKRIQDVVICKENDSILEVSRILRDTKSRHLVVINNNKKPIGIISTVDINNRVVAQELDYKKTNAGDVMTKNIDVVDIKDSFDKACEKMISKGTYSIPVVENGKLIGIIGFNELFCKVKEHEGVKKK